MYPHHPVEADEGAGSLNVTDGAFGGEDCIGRTPLNSGGEGVTVAASITYK